MIDGTKAFAFDGDLLKIEFDAFEVHHHWLLRRALADLDTGPSRARGYPASVRPMIYRRLNGAVDTILVNVGAGEFGKHATCRLL